MLYHTNWLPKAFDRSHAPCGNASGDAPASRVYPCTLGLSGDIGTQSVRGSILTRSAHRYTQVEPSQENRHFGMDAEIQAMDGNQTTVQVLDSGNLPSHSFPSVDPRASVVSHSLPSLDDGFRHPCRNDGSPTLVYNDERGNDTIYNQAAIWL